MPTGSGGARASDHPATGGPPRPSPAEPPKSGPVSPSGPAPTPSPAAPGRSGGRYAALPKACPTCKARYPADFKVCPRDASPLVDAADDGTDPLLGTTLGDAYQVVRMVGGG